MIDKRQKATKFKCKRDESITKQSVFLEYVLLSKFFFRVLLELVRKGSQNFTIIDQEKHKIKQILHRKPHDYRIYYLNIDLRYQYGRSSWRRAARRNGCIRRLSQSCLFFKLKPYKTLLNYRFWKTHYAFAFEPITLRFSKTTITWNLLCKLINSCCFIQDKIKPLSSGSDKI